MRIFFLLILLATPSYAAENVFTIHKPLDEIVVDTHNNFLETASQMDRLPRQLFDLDLLVTVKGLPKQRYYKFEIKLLRSYGKLKDLHKTLEMWGRHNRVIVRSRLNIVYGKQNRRFPFRWITRLVNRVVNNRVEPTVLCIEERKLKEFLGVR